MSINSLFPNGFKVKSIILIISLLVSAYISSIIPMYFRHLLDKGILMDDKIVVHSSILAIFLLSIINSIIKIYNGAIINGVGLFVTKRVKEYVIDRVFSSSLEFFDRLSAAELVQRIKEVEIITSIFNPQYLTVVGAIVSAALAIYRVAKMDARLIITYLIAFPTMMLCSLYYSRKYKEMTYSLVKLNTIASEEISQGFLGIKEIKTDNAIEEREKKIKDIQESINNTTRKQNILYSYNNELISTINILVSLVTVVLFYKLFIKEQVTVGVYTALTQYTAMIMMPAQMITSIISIIQPTSVLIKRLSFFGEIEKQDVNKGETLKEIQKIETKDLSFSYGEKKVLKNVFFSLGMNEKAVLKGSNGSGKTTLIKLLLRLYDHYEGDIIINNVKASNYSIKSIRDNIAVVFQEPFLFSDSLYNNIKQSKKNASREEIIDAIVRSGLKDNMPTLDIDEIMNIKILENGKNVSGGQKRMIAIARALLKKPSLLILDEPTTFLDNKTKEILKNTIINLNNMMVLVVTHDNYFDSFISKKIVLHD